MTTAVSELTSPPWAARDQSCSSGQLKRWPMGSHFTDVPDKRRSDTALVAPHQVPAARAHEQDRDQYEASDHHGVPPGSAGPSGRCTHSEAQDPEKDSPRPRSGRFGRRTVSAAEIGPAGPPSGRGLAFEEPYAVQQFFGSAPPEDAGAWWTSQAGKPGAQGFLALPRVPGEACRPGGPPPHRAAASTRCRSVTWYRAPPRCEPRAERAGRLGTQRGGRGWRTTGSGGEGVRPPGVQNSTAALCRPGHWVATSRAKVRPISCVANQGSTRPSTSARANWQDPAQHRTVVLPVGRRPVRRRRLASSSTSGIFSREPGSPQWHALGLVAARAVIPAKRDIHVVQGPGRVGARRKCRQVHRRHTRGPGRFPPAEDLTTYQVGYLFGLRKSPNVFVSGLQR